MADGWIISEQWTEEVRIFMEASPEDVPADRGSLRLSKALMNTKTEAYAPQMVSLGPYHHFSLKDESAGPFHERLTHLSQMEMWKLRSAREAAGNDPELVKKMFARVSQSDMISNFEQFYAWKISNEHIPRFAWMMMIDALFLSNFLRSGLDDARPESSVRSAASASKDLVLPAKASIRCDIVKLENQIPLSLLTTLEDIDEEMNTLDSLLPSLTTRLSSFQISDIQERDVSGKQDLKEKHLLGCIHKHVASFVQVSSVEEEPPTWRQWIAFVMGNLVAFVFIHPAIYGRPDFLEKYNAKELVRAGIKFKSFKDQGKIRFCRYSDTLYLPQITIFDTYTEVLLRNLLALEFNDPGREKHVSNYVELMDFLIDTPEDVAFLRESQVIDRQSMMITDEYVAKMWDGMSKPFFLAGFLELPGGLKVRIREVFIKQYNERRLDYFKSKVRSWWDEFRISYLSSPWKLAGLLVGVFVLLLTMVQTYCSLKECQPNKNKNMKCK